MGSRSLKGVNSTTHKSCMYRDFFKIPFHTNRQWLEFSRISTYQNHSHQKQSHKYLITETKLKL